MSEDTQSKLIAFRNTSVTKEALAQLAWALEMSREELVNEETP